MKIFVLTSTDPYLNLAFEEYLFRETRDTAFILWQNDNTIVIGKNQNPYIEINTREAAARGIRIARRITGGGTVYHDLGNVNYSFITDKEKSDIDFEAYTKPITDALLFFGIKASLSGRNDLLLEDGRKVSGNAQFSDGKRLLHHGTLLFDSDLDLLASVLKADPEKLASKAIRSTRSRVANLKPLMAKEVSVGEFIERLASFVELRFSAERCEPIYCSEVEALRRRNASREWIYPERDLLSRYTVSKKKRFSFGSVEACFQMRGEEIISAEFFGDFFSAGDIDEILKIAKGKTLAEYCAALSEFDIGKYIVGMSHSDVKALLDGQ